MKNLLVFFLVLSFSTILSAQNVAINSDGTDANSDAILHLKSTSKGLVIPSMSTGQRTSISNVSNGLLVYDTSTNSFWYRDSGTWYEIVAGDIDNSILEDDDSNTKVQVEESSNDNQIRFDINGTEQMIMRDNGNGLLLMEFQKDNNLFIGKDAGLNTNPSFPDGQSNTLLGFRAGTANSSGSFNTYLGKSAGESNVDGYRNTFLGTQSGDGFTTGSDNTIVGMGTASNQSSGDYNTYVGTSAGSNKTGGNNNTFLGYRSGRLNSTGSGNIFIGYLAGSTVSSSNRLMIDNSNTSAPLIDGSFSSDQLTINGDLEVSEALEISSAATSNPDAGSFYSNTAPLAYGRISNSSLITTDYGISSVTKTATGVYEVIIDNSFTVTPVVLVTPSSTVAGSAYSATYFTTSPNKITVNINNEAGNAEDQPFSIMVMGW
jgi:hypothetical protein